MNFKQFAQINENINLHDWLEKIYTEGNTTSRYSIEVNYRTNKKEVIESFAKISLGYISAALKQNGYHVKQYFDEPPMRVLISSRNWDDGEFIGAVSFNPNLDNGSFVISKGFWNRDKKTVSVQSSQKCPGQSAAEVVSHLREIMISSKGENRHKEKLRPLTKKGPKR